jgi:hypothetical protein
MKRRRLLAALAVAPGTLVLPGPARADLPAISAHDGVAIRGADCVSYFSEGRHRQGLPDLAIRWRGAIWLFSRPETMAAFEMNPTAYSPQFGGYCALAMAFGKLSDGNPDAFLLHEGALYLFASSSALSQAEGDVGSTLAAARANWPAVLDD